MVKKQPNYKLHVLYGVTLGFILVFSLHIAKGKLSLVDTSKSEDTLTNTFKGDSVNEAIVAWGFIAVILFSAAMFESTAPLAAAFAWLILFAVLLINADTVLEIANGIGTGDLRASGGKKKRG